MKPLVAAWLVLLCLNTACAQDDDDDDATQPSNVAVGKRGNLSRLASSDIFVYIVAGIGGLCLLACCAGCVYTAFFADKGKDASDSASAPLDPNRRVPGRMRRIAEANDKKRAATAAAASSVDLYEAPPVDVAATGSSPDAAAAGTCVVAVASETAATPAAAASTSQASSLSTSSRSSTRPLATRAPSMGRGGAASLRESSPLSPPRRGPNADAFADGIEC